MAKALVKKIGQTVSDSVDKIIPKGQDDTNVSQQQQQQRGQSEIYREPRSGGEMGGLIGGLLGRSMGALMGTMMESAASALQQAAEQSRGVYQVAVDAVSRDPRVRERLGGAVSCSQPVSQSSSS